MYYKDDKRSLRDHKEVVKVLVCVSVKESARYGATALTANKNRSFRKYQQQAKQELQEFLGDFQCKDGSSPKPDCIKESNTCQVYSDSLV